MKNAFPCGTIRTSPIIISLILVLWNATRKRLDFAMGKLEFSIEDADLAAAIPKVVPESGTP